MGTSLKRGRSSIQLLKKGGREKRGWPKCDILYLTLVLSLSSEDREQLALTPLLNGVPYDVTSPVKCHF